jgi:hypothetical protein
VRNGEDLLKLAGREGTITELVGGLEHLDYDFPFILGRIIIPTDELIFFNHHPN